MTDLNKHLLTAIDSIDEESYVAEMDVLIAINNEYAKAAMLMEYANEEVLDEFEVIQETALFCYMESTETEKANKAAAKEAKKANKEAEKQAKEQAKENAPIVHKGDFIDKFKGWIKNIINAIKLFFKKLFHISDENVKEVAAPPADLNESGIKSGHAELKHLSMYDGRIDSEVQGQTTINIFTDRDYGKWRRWRENLEYFVLGGYSEDMREINKVSSHVLSRKWDSEYEMHKVFGPITHKRAKLKANMYVLKWMVERIKEDKKHEHKGQKDFKGKWGEKITPEIFGKALNSFQGEPELTENGYMILKTNVVVDNGMKIGFDLDPGTMSIKTNLRTDKGDKQYIDVVKMAATYYEISELFAKMVEYKENFNQMISEYNKRMRDISSKLDSIESNKNDGATLKQFCEAINTDGPTFTRAKEYMDKFMNAIPSATVLSNSETISADMKSAFTRMTNDAGRFLKLLKNYQTVITHGRNAVIIFKVFCGYCEFISTYGYVQVANAPAGDVVRKKTFAFFKH